MAVPPRIPGITDRAALASPAQAEDIAVAGRAASREAVPSGAVSAAGGALDARAVDGILLLQLYGPASSLFSLHSTSFPFCLRIYVINR
jgi:hypothetical protein